MATAREGKQVAKEFGAEVIVMRGRINVDVQAWSPAGFAWNSTCCHVIHETGERDEAGVIWDDVIRGMRQGIGPCDGVDCDTCNPGE